MAELDIERIYDEHADALFAFVLTMTRNETDTHDNLQELFSQLVRHPERLGGVREERPFLLKLAYHTAIDQFRRRGTRDRVQSQLSEEEHELFAPPEDPYVALHQRLQWRCAVLIILLEQDNREVSHGGDCVLYGEPSKSLRTLSQRRPGPNPSLYAGSTVGFMRRSTVPLSSHRR